MVNSNDNTVINSNLLLVVNVLVIKLVANSTHIFDDTMA